MNDLFNATDIPFNLSGERIDNSVTAEGEARVRALAESEAKKAQTNLDFNRDLIGHCETYPFCPLHCQCRKPPTPSAAWIETPTACYLTGKVYPLHDDTNENAL